MDRNDAIKQIKEALKRRSGKSWSVTGGRGTAWGWITIDAPPARRTMHGVLKSNVSTWPAEYEAKDTGVPGGHITDADRRILGELLNLEFVDCLGVRIPAGYAYYQEYIDRANGREPTIRGKRYWD